MTEGNARFQQPRFGSPWLALAMLLSLAEPSHAHAIKDKTAWEGTLETILGEEGWDIEKVYKNEQGKTVVVMRNSACKPGKIAFCETSAESFIDTPQTRKLTQCFVPPQSDWCGYGTDTEF